MRHAVSRPVAVGVAGMGPARSANLLEVSELRLFAPTARNSVKQLASVYKAIQWLLTTDIILIQSIKPNWSPSFIVPSARPIFSKHGVWQ